MRRLWVLILILNLACSSLPTLDTPRFRTQSEIANSDNSGFSEKNSQTRGLTFAWPVTDGVVTQEFRHKKKRKRPHKGIDIAAPKGDGVFAAHEGTVIYGGKHFRGFGKLIIIESPDGEWASFYSHLNKILVKEGALVKMGEHIGHIGRTGRATGYHLHFELRHQKQAVNPLKFLP